MNGLAVSAPPGFGLTTEGVAARVRDGHVNQGLAVSTRSVRDILKENVATPFNAVLGTLFVLIIIIGPPQDGVFGLILLANIVIGVGQELRAKWALERMSLVAARKARVWRDGALVELPLAEIVVDDAIEVRGGDQVVVDGVVLSADGLEVNEALVTGESAPVPRTAGGRLLSGSFVTAGAGCYRATLVGTDTYAGRLTAEARMFGLAHSEMRRGINRIITAVGLFLVPVGALLVRSQVLVSPNAHEAIRSSVAGLVTMVPEGLVLLTSLALAVAVAGLARQGALAQELAAVEVLARADTVCLDKTGTLTDGTVQLEGIDNLDHPPADNLAALAGLAASREGPDMAAIAAGGSPGPWVVDAAIPFSSERRWSAVRYSDHGWWALGAPEVLLSAGGALERARTAADGGSRVLALVHAGAEGVVPGTHDAAALVSLREHVREEVAAVLGGLAAEAVRLVVLSGDDPRTARAVAARAGLEVSEPALEWAGVTPPSVRQGGGPLVIGRVSPEGKRDVVASLQRAGHTVAMIGDGVNDVLAMKQADVGIALGEGTDAARAVAQVVLARGGFASVPGAINEGRRVIANVERLAALFVTKTVYAVVIASVVALSIDPFPFLPRQLTLIGTFTVGLPAFILTLERNHARPHRGFLWRTLRFALPAGLLAATVTYLAYNLAAEDAGVSLDVARTTATLVLAGVALWLVSVLVRPWTRLRAAVVAGMTALVCLVVAAPAGREFFALYPPPPLVALAGVGLVAMAGAALEVTARISGLMAMIRITLAPPPGTAAA